MESLTVSDDNSTDSRPLNLSPYFADLAAHDLLHWVGHVREMVGLLIESEGPAAASATFARCRQTPETEFAARSSAFATAAYSPCRSMNPSGCNSEIAL